MVSATRFLTVMSQGAFSGMVASQAESASGGGGAASEKLNLLVADDDPVIRRLVSTCLGSQFNLTVVKDGQEALAVLKERGHAFQGLLTDGQMPNMSGVELMQAVRNGEAPAFTGVMMIMSGNMFNHEEALNSLGIPTANRIEKPFPSPMKASLVQMINGALEALK